LVQSPIWGGSWKGADIAIQAEHILKLKKKLTKILAENSGQPFDRVSADCERDYYMSAKEALDYGIIDKVFTKRS